MSQLEAIRQHLESGKPITPLDALNLYGCFRLGARIFDLKRQGMNISCDTAGNGDKHYATYRLIMKREPNGQMVLCV